ncbi:hypothetical protein SCB49_13410 [unidentified eubacterium SCB49]|nr:hypothetical protein SCB49_13410 [unidentified eubacterium SCB49]
MRIRQRFLFYGIGFAIGILLLYFFVGGSGASCDYSYGPNSRVLKNIRLKERVFSEISTQQLSSNQLDTAAISVLLRNGNVLFSESNTNLDSCKIYVIEGSSKEKELKMTVQNCDSIATIQKVEVFK